jgi:hypothetical protein
VRLTALNLAADSLKDSPFRDCRASVQACPKLLQEAKQQLLNSFLLFCTGWLEISPGAARAKIFLRDKRSELKAV